MSEGIIIKALSGFYYIEDGDRTVSCRAKGRFRHDGTSPLVGDRVTYIPAGNGTGTVENILPRKNSFIRPAVANIDALVFVACASRPVTDPFLIDRVSVIAEKADCELIICLNKTDEDSADELFHTYLSSGFTVVRTSAESGEGIEELRNVIQGRICAFTGNSGAGKSSIINRLVPGANIETAVISDALGRGKHTTRHVEFYPVDGETFVADTPGFASFEIEMVEQITAEELPELFREIARCPGGCRFDDCRHISEPGCAIKSAVDAGAIPVSRYASYTRLYEIVKNRKPWN